MQTTHQTGLAKSASSANFTLHLADRALGVLIALLAIAAGGMAQTAKPTDGSTPLALEAGAPEGAYSLSGFDNVNLYNGSLNFSLPLLKIGGRGTAGHMIVLPIERHWMMEKFTDDQQNIWVYPIDGREEEIKPGYGPGIMAIRYGGIGNAPCEWHPPNIHYDIDRRYTATVTRLSFTRPDGGEIEFRDVLRGGGYATAQLCGNHDPSSIGFNRGKVFASVDGSLMTFISDTDIRDEVLVGSLPPESPVISGFMLLPDGTRYRIDGGLVSWIRDRNGNKITFVYGGGVDGTQVTSITDSLNRQVTIAYDVNEGGQYGVCDKITYRGFGGATRVIRVSKTSLGNVLRSGYSLTTYGYLFPNGGGGANNYNPTVVSSVWLPDSDGVTRRYQFQYNNYGELARVVLPTGGAYEYDYGAGTTNGTSDGLMFGYPSQQIYRRVLERRVYPDGGTGSGYAVRMTYSVPESQDCCSTTTVGYVTAEQRDASNNLLASSSHYFSGPGAGNTWHSPIALQSQMDGKENQTDALDTNGTTVLRRSVSTWQAGAPIAANPSASINPRVIETDTTLEPGGANLVSKQTFAYDQYNNQTDVYEYDYGSGSAGALVRHSQTSYLTTQGGYDYSCDPSSTCSTSANIANVIHIRTLPTQSSIYDAGGVERARASFEYDNYVSDANHAALVYDAAISGLDSGFTTSYTTRGNSTSSTQYFLVNGTVTGSITAYAQYDMAGNTVKSIDARGFATLFDFTDRFGSPDGEATSNAAPIELSAAGQASYAMPTLVTNAANHTTYSQFDYYLGRPVNAQDANGIVFAGSYNDVLDRPTQVIRDFNNVSAKGQTTFTYDENNRTITTTSDQTAYADNVLKNQVLYDGLGRTTESRQYEGGTNYIAVQTQYDALGRAFRTSNPFRPWNSESAIWTTTAFDALSRVLTVTTPDSAVVTSNYAGNSVTVTDQGAKSRKSVTDALGRLTSVYEDPNGVNYLTSYVYDVLDDLTQVSQGSQTRTFVYDSLKRLTSANNPESGTVSYQYDNNGNLTQKTDARSITTTITYDVLNRATSKSYQNDGGLTPAVAYFYDSQTLPSGAPTFSRGYSTGRLVAVTYGGGSAGNYFGYDALGRTSRKIQQTDSVNYLIDASYNVSGMTGETYPSVPGASDRRTVSYTPDRAGRLASLNSNATSYAAAASVSNIGYASHNAPNTETCGNNLIHAVTYNNRLQATEIKLGTSSNPTSILDLTYNYGSTNNNGNVQSLSYSGAGLSYTQTFGYDSLNRLTTSVENGGSNWSQTNGYDQYGNRWIDYGGGNHNLAFSTSTNRITTAGFNYDASGNLTNDSIHSYTFDGENRIVKVDATTAYVYDGEAHRVRKLVGENTRFIYGISGDPVAEFDGSTGNLKKEYVSGGPTLITIEPSAVNSNGTQYATSDHLGSPRIITNSSGAVVSRHDYLPFGEELFAGTGGRTTAQGYSVSDGVRHHFTGYEADGETGLNFAQARYQSPAQGRFTSVDPLGKSASVFNPQTFNRYSYVLNNPLNLVDPMGRQAQKHPPAKKPGDEIGGDGCVGDCGTPTGVIAEVTVTAPPAPIVYEFEYPLNVPQPVPPPTAPTAGGGGAWGVLGKLLGAAGIILASPVSTGGGDTCPGGCCTCQTTTSAQPDTSANPAEDNKPDTGDSTRNDDDNSIVFRVQSPGQPAFQLKPNEPGISVFNPNLVQPPLTPGEVLQNFRPGSNLVTRTRNQISALGLQLIRTPGADVLSLRLRAAHMEIRPGPGMSRNAFKTALKGLN